MPAQAEIVVIAGTNGAGKSSVAGAALRESGTVFYDPDRATRVYLDEGLPLPDANSRAWHRGRRQLEQAVREGLDYAFETTLGGRTITGLLLEAAALGHAVRIWYVGLETVELHLRRVRQRVARGGHHIPETKIRERWDASRRNLIRLLPEAAELQLYDNSHEAAPEEGKTPRPVCLLHMKAGRIRGFAPPDTVPDWAKPILVAAFRDADRS